MLDDDTTTQADLHGGRSPWGSLFARPGSHIVAAGPRHDRRCDVLVVGAGITGSLVAASLVERGHSVVIVDAEQPGHGSTAASTAMLQWEIDTPLTELAGHYGMEKAARCYRSSVEAVQGLGRMIGRLGVDCAFNHRQTLYLAAGETGEDELRAELAVRRQAGLAGDILDRRALLDRFGIDRAAAILSPGSADADPVRLAQGMLKHATARGADFLTGKAEHYDAAGRSVGVLLESGTTVEARHVVLATGYVMPDFVRCDIHSAASSWAIATRPQAPEALWPDRVLMWEASNSYSYTRITEDGRIIFGGEDDSSVVESEARDALIPTKAQTLSGLLTELWPKADPEPAYAWSGAFGETADGLPLIGPVEGHKGVLAAYGYGGNGITFSYLASRMLPEMIEGRYSGGHEDFAIRRPDPR